MQVNVYVNQIAKFRVHIKIIIYIGLYYRIILDYINLDCQKSLHVKILKSLTLKLMPVFLPSKTDYRKIKIIQKAAKKLFIH